MIAYWIVFPLVMLAACTGCGLLLEAISGWRLPGMLVPLSGLAVAIVAVSFTTNWTTTAEASTPLLVVLAVAGYVVGAKRLRQLELDPWATAAGILVFAICAAPVVMSGNATFLGYYILSDSSFHMGLANLLVGHGPNVADLPQSGYTSLLYGYLTTDYPTGADAGLGALSKLAGEDVSWTFQPYIAVVIALGGAALYGLLGEVVASRPLRAACAVVAGANGLVFSLYTVASIKELVMASVLTLFAFVAVKSVKQPSLRGLIPGIIVGACSFDVLGITAVPWIGVPVAAFGLASLWRFRAKLRGFAQSARRGGLTQLPRRTARGGSLLKVGPILTVAGLGLVAVAYPIIAKAPTFLRVSGVVLNASQDTNVNTSLSYLAAPLSKWQMLGIWPDYDFRFTLEAHLDITFILIGIELASAVLGGVWMIRRRAWAPLLLLAGSGVSAIYLLDRSTPYAASKVMVIVSVAIVMTVTTGAAALHDARRRVEAWLLIAVLAAGVLWTDGLAYRYDSVAPSARLHELATINASYSGQGPTLFPYGAEWTALYLLRSIQPTTGHLTGVIPRPGLKYTGFQLTNLRWDTDNLSEPFVQGFKLIVMDGSPAFSRPPADYTLARRGRYYNVWRRTSQPQVIEHVGFGTYPYSSAVPSCRMVTATARLAEQDHGRLDYVLGSTTATLIPANLPHPSGWVPIAGDPLELIPRQGAGTVSGTITVPKTGTYQVWFDGSVSQRFTVSVDGEQIGSIANQLGSLQQATKIATVHLAKGSDRVTINRPAANSLLPGADDVNPNNRAVGPLMFVENSPNYTVSSVSPNRARTLCGKSLDWLEVVR